LHNELIKADLDGSDIYNEDSEDYIFSSAWSLDRKIIQEGS
jgi:hypothetical protein